MAGPLPANEKKTLTPLELEIMQILWQDGPSTVNDVRPKLKSQLAYNTVQTMLTVLLRKGKVKRVQEGRAFRYTPTVDRKRATGTALQDLVRRMFGGSPEALLLAMVESRQIGPRELARLNEMVAEAEKKAAEEK
jgi:BlaI family transcriptional regulator, penicillinase repressor